MKICFVLPRFSRRPIGGYKIVFEYANRLSEKGYEVLFLFLNNSTFVENKIPEFMKPFGNEILTQKEPQWFILNKSIQKISATSWGYKKKIENVDVCIATSVETVEPCESLFPKAKKLYFIQDYENWVVNADYVHLTYKKGFKNIVISNWLEKIVNQYADEKSILIRNPIDLNIYSVITPLCQRKEHTIGLLYHPGEHKGLSYSFRTLECLKMKYPDLAVYMFGTSEPDVMPAGIKEFIRDASVQQTVKLYNSVSVFMCSSIDEGYGLTGMEAMACGAALASTDYPAVHEYAVDKINALLSPVRDVEAMVENISRLFDEPEYRFQIATNGVNHLRNYSWSIATNLFEETFYNK